MRIEIIEEKSYNPQTDKWDGDIDSLFVDIINHNKCIGCCQIDLYNGIMSTNNFDSKKGFHNFLCLLKRYMKEFNIINNTNYNRIIFLSSNSFYNGVDFSLLKKDGENYYYEF